VLFEADPNEPIETLFAKVKTGAVQGFNNRTSVFAIPPFAALLVRLANDADKRAAKVEALTRQLFWLTVGLLILTVFLLIFTAYLAYKEHNKGAETGAVRPWQSQINRAPVVHPEAPEEERTGMVNHPNRSKKKKAIFDAERHTRFKDMAKEVGASEDPKEFEKAFIRVATPNPNAPGKSSRNKS